MGITGLLPFVKKASRPCFLREFNGSVAAVDTYCWLHKGAFSCAEKLARGEDTDGYVVYVMKMVYLLLSHRIKPIMVFDGCNLPSKAGTEAKRRESRAKNRALAKEHLREGRVREARECFQRCIDVTSHMARAVMTACRQINVDVIVAPYEADAQLAYLVQAGFADLVITEDSDLILFGCERVIFKLDNSGGGVLVEQDKLHLAMSIPPHKFSLEMFRHMCVLSGCDYLPSLPGIGLAKACKFFKLTSNTDVFNALCKLPSYLKLPQLEVNLEYREGFRRAVLTFLHQLVFCPRERRLRPLIQPDDGSEPSDHPYAGAFIGHERALQIALGNIDVQSGQQVDHFNPDRHKAPAMKSSGWESSGDKVAEYSSIWLPDYDRNAFRERCAADRKAGRNVGLAAFVANNTRKRDKAWREGGVGQEEKQDELSRSKEKKQTVKHGEVKKVMDIKSLFAKRKREIEDEANDSMSDLLALYRCPTKTPKKEAPDLKPPSAPTPCRSPGGKEETSATPNLFAKYRRSPSKNPFAKYKLNESDHRSKTTESLSTVKVKEDTYPVTSRDIDTNKEAVQDTISLPYCTTTRLKCNLDFDLDNAKDVLLEGVSGTTDTKFVEENENNKKTAMSPVVAEEKITTSNCLADLNVLAKIHGKDIIIKSKYFRPAGSAPARSAAKSNFVKVVPKTVDNHHCSEDATTAKDYPTTFPTLGTSISNTSGAQTNQRDSDEDQSQINDLCLSVGGRESLLRSASLSRTFSFQSTKLDPTPSYNDVQTLPAYDRVSAPTRSSIDVLTSCGPDEAEPLSSLLTRRASHKRRAHAALSMSQERSEREASIQVDVTEYSLSGSHSEMKDCDSSAPCSDGYRDSQASLGGSSTAGVTESSLRSHRSELLDDSCDNESFGLTPLLTMEKQRQDLDSTETFDLVSLSSGDGEASQSAGDDNEVEDDTVEYREKSQSLVESKNANISSFKSRSKSKYLEESHISNLSKSESKSNFADPNSDVAVQSSLEEESPYQTNCSQSQNISENSFECSTGESVRVEACDDLPTELLGKTVSPALVEQQREILKALENKSLQTSISSSPYFSKKPDSALKSSSCRRPGLSRPAKGGRQLNLRDMFALKK